MKIAQLGSLTCMTIYKHYSALQFHQRTIFVDDIRTRLHAVRKLLIRVCEWTPSSIKGFASFRNSPAKRTTVVVPSPTCKMKRRIILSYAWWSQFWYHWWIEITDPSISISIQNIRSVQMNDSQWFLDKNALQITSDPSLLQLHYQMTCTLSVT